MNASLESAFAQPALVVWKGCSNWGRRVELERPAGLSRGRRWFCGGGIFGCRGHWNMPGLRLWVLFGFRGFCSIARGSDWFSFWCRFGDGFGFGFSVRRVQPSREQVSFPLQRRAGLLNENVDLIGRRCDQFDLGGCLCSGFWLLGLSGWCSGHWRSRDRGYCDRADTTGADVDFFSGSAFDLVRRPRMLT